MERKRYYSIDVMKAVCAFLVVCIHCPLPDKLGGTYLNIFARMAVPFFFWTSGFFAFNKSKNNKVLQHCLIMLGVDFVYGFVNYVVFGEQVINSITSVQFILVNFNLASHMWFMRALIYIEIFANVFHKFLKEHKLTKYIICLWILDVVLIKYSIVYSGNVIPQPYRELLTKYIGTGVVYYFLGWEYKRNEEKIAGVVKEWKKWLYLFAILLVGVTIFEFSLLEYYSINVMPVNYISNFILVNVIFILLLSNLHFLSGSIMYYIGNKLSMHIYFWHPLLIKMSQRFADALELNYKSILVNPLNIYIESIVVALCILWIKKYIHIKKFRLNNV